MYNIKNQREGWKTKNKTRHQIQMIYERRQGIKVKMNAGLKTGIKKFLKENIHPFKEGKYFVAELKHLHSQSNQ